MPEPPQIRTIAICVFCHGSRILVAEGYDTAGGQVFHRPVGGGIHFGETSREALLREIAEELGRPVLQPRLLGVLENLFTCDGAQGHEIVFVYDARFSDPAAYREEALPGLESCGTPFRAVWRDLADGAEGLPPLYPDGLAGMLAALD